jgi:hypothetical protein
MSNETKQTAVEWFHQKTWGLKIQLELGEISMGEYANTYATLYNQAKEMEREQIEETFQSGKWDWAEHIVNDVESKDASEYYNEKYGGNK